IPLRSDSILLGRTSQAHIYLPEPEIRRRHARLSVTERPNGLKGVSIQDLHSVNGTFVNGQRIEASEQSMPLESGDILRLGIHAFKLKHLDPVERTYHESMLAQTTLDPLTGVSNRVTVLSFLEKHSDLALRHQRALSLIICDLDYFKNVNDSWGHAAGDEVLSFFGGLLIGRLRTSDQVGRIGGEEFLLVLPETLGHEAISVAEDLRHTLETAHIAVPNLAEPLRVTCCFGVAELTDADGTGLSFLARADAALYRAKAAGRNRVEFDEVP
ncbi:MAG: GGDEF domain-containing protein, partial [Holophaga sp.]|nr:GGDEF domain-containing protein [Holophaga sp.]